MSKEIDLSTQSGPCTVCGERDYPLSCGGPAICPACDCGTDLKTRLDPYRKRIIELENGLRSIKHTLDQYLS